MVNNYPWDKLQYITYISTTYGIIIRFGKQVDGIITYNMKDPEELVYTQYTQEARYAFLDLFIHEQCGPLTIYSKAAKILFMRTSGN